MTLPLVLTSILAALWFQDPSYESLIDRLGGSDPIDREEAASKLAAAGPAALPELEKASVRTQDAVVVERIGQVRNRIRLKLHTPALDEGFTPAFRKAAPDLVLKLRNPTHDVLLKALEAVTGYRVEFDPRARRFRTLAGLKIPEATPADAALVFRIALSVIPPRDDSDWWKPVKAVMSPAAHLHKSASMLEYGVIHLDDPDREFRGVVDTLTDYGQRRRFAPVYVRLLDSPQGDVVEHACRKLRTLNPGEHAEKIAERIDAIGGISKAWLLECLARTGDPKWKPVFLKYISDPNETVRGSSVKALSMIDAKAAIPHVLAMLNSPHERVVMAGIHAAPGVADARLWRALEDVVLRGSNPMAANQAIYALTKCPPPNAEEILVKSMKHPSHVVRNAAAVNASWVDSEDVLRGLKELLSDPEEAVRQNAQRSITMIKTKGKAAPEKAPSGPAGRPDPSRLDSLLAYLEGENEQYAFGEFMRIRLPALYEKVLHLPLNWPEDRHPTVRELLDQTAELLKAQGMVLDVKLATVDERPRISRNSPKMVVGLLFWLIPVNLGQEYGWYLEEGRLSLLPIDEARVRWREWAQSQARK